MDPEAGIKLFFRDWNTCYGCCSTAAFLSAIQPRRLQIQIAYHKFRLPSFFSRFSLEPSRVFSLSFPSFRLNYKLPPAIIAQLPNDAFGRYHANRCTAAPEKKQIPDSGTKEFSARCALPPIAKPSDPNMVDEHSRCSTEHRVSGKKRNKSIISVSAHRAERKERKEKGR